MNFSGNLDESGGMTVTRLIERIVHTDTPGELRLHDESSGRRATVAIRRGTVEDVHFGELSGDAALTGISQTMPWKFEFVADESGAMPAHPGIVSRRPRARAIIKPAPVAVPMEEAPQPEPEFTFSPAQMHWLASADSAHSIRFGAAGTAFSGPVDPDDHAYFRSDCDYLRSTAARIARSLGLEPPRVFAIAEEERATGYCDIPGGFLGIMAGAGAGVHHVILFPDE
jgi:hypothetical protein